MQNIFANPAETLLAVLLAGVAVLVASLIVPGFNIKGGIVSAMLIGFVYGLLKLILRVPLAGVADTNLLLGGAFVFFFTNALLLWLTDKLIRRLDISSWTGLFLGTLVLSAFDILVLGGAAFF